VFRDEPGFITRNNAAEKAHKLHGAGGEPMDVNHCNKVGYFNVRDRGIGVTNHGTRIMNDQADVIARGMGPINNSGQPSKTARQLNRPYSSGNLRKIRVRVDPKAPAAGNCNREAARASLTTNPAIPKYAGHVPRSYREIGKTFGQVCREQLKAGSRVLAPTHQRAPTPDNVTIAQSSWQPPPTERAAGSEAKARIEKRRPQTARAPANRSLYDNKQDSSLEGNTTFLTVNQASYLMPPDTRPPGARRWHRRGTDFPQRSEVAAIAVGKLRRDDYVTTSESTYTKHELQGRADGVTAEKRPHTVVAESRAARPPLTQRVVVPPAQRPYEKPPPFELIQGYSGSTHPDTPPVTPHTDRGRRVALKSSNQVEGAIFGAPDFPRATPRPPTSEPPRWQTSSMAEQAWMGCNAADTRHS